MERSLEQLAEDLHRKLAEDLLERLKSGEATAAELNVARQFLKDNGIDVIVAKRGTIRKIADVLPFAEDGPITKADAQ